MHTAWHRAKQSLACLFAALTAIALTASPGLADEFDRVVPENVVTYLQVRNYSEMKQELEGTPYAEMMEDPDLQKLSEKMTDSLADAMEEFHQKSGVSLEDIESVLHGQIAMVNGQGAGLNLEMNGGDQQNGMILIDVGPNEDTADELIEDLLAKAEEEDSTDIGQETVGGHNVHRVTIQTDEAADEMTDDNDDLDPELKERMQGMTGGEPMEVFVSLEDGILVISAGTDDTLLESHFALRDDTEDAPDALAGLELYERLNDRVDGSNADYMSFQNYDSVWQTMQQEDAESSALPFDVTQVMEELGIFDMRGQISTVNIGEDGLRSDGFVAIPAPRRGIFRAFDPDESDSSGEGSVPDFVGADAAIYAGSHFDVPVLWEEIQNVIQAVNPDTYNQMRQMIEGPQVPIHLEKDFIDTLGSRWNVYLPDKVVRENGEGSVHLLLAIDLNDAEKLGNTIQTLLQLPQLQETISTDTVEGNDIHSTTSSPALQQMLDSQDAPPVRLSFGIIKDRLVIGLSPEALEDAIAAGEDEAGLNSLKEYQQVMSDGPDNPDTMLFMDLRTAGSWLWTAVDRAMEEGETEVELPSYDVFEKYLHVVGSEFKWGEDGLESSAFMPFK
ncbi:MAG: hypothetical protein ACOCSQ_04130 [Planctomycetota bacterium]